MRAVIVLVALTGVARAEPAPATEVRGHASVIVAAHHAIGATTRATQFTLDRCEVGAEAAIADRATAEVAVESVRSAGPDSFAGIDGDSILVRVKRAALGGRWRHRSGLEGAGQLGLVADPWIAALDGYPFHTAGVSLPEAAQLIATSDLGVAATLALPPSLQLTVTVTNGEGANQRERNQGKNTAAVVQGRVALGPGQLVLAGFARDGSVGPGSTRSHRLGAALGWRQPRLAAGVDALLAWGVGARPDVIARALEGWLDVRAYGPTGITARLDRLTVIGPIESGTGWRVAFGAWYQLVPSLRATAVVGFARDDAAASAIAGAPAATETTRLSFVVEGHLEGVR